MHPTFPGLPTASSPLMQRFDAGSVSGHRAADETAKCPEPLCPMSIVASSGRRVPPPGRALSLRPRSYGLMRQSPPRSPLLRPQPRSRSLRRLLPAPAASGIFPTLSLRIFPWMLGPLPRRDPRVLLPVSSSGVIGLPQISIRSASRFFPPKRFLGGDNFRGCRHFFMFGPPSLLAPQIVPTAARLRAGQPGLLRPSRTCVVASACIGYASHPNTGN
jgi:hypothetical protein